MDCMLVHLPWCPDNMDRHACLDVSTSFEVDLPIKAGGTYAEGVREYIALGWRPTKPGAWLIIDLERDPIGGMIVTIDDHDNVVQGTPGTTSVVPRLTTWPPKK